MAFTDDLNGVGSLQDRDKAAFTPDGSGGVARKVKITNTSDIGDQKGETLAAGETISAVKAVYSNGTNLFLGDANENFQHASIVGISITAGGIGDEIRYLLNGPLYDSSFVFTDGEPVYLAENGGFTQTDPDTLGYLYRVYVGIATGSNGININIDDPIEL